MRFIVPYRGAALRIVARMVGAQLSELYKQPFLIENRPGANGTIGGDVVLKSPADGHAVLFESQSIAVTPAIKKERLRRAARLPAGCADGDAGLHHRVDGIAAGEKPSRWWRSRKPSPAG